MRPLFPRYIFHYTDFQWLFPNSVSLEANAREKLDGSFSPLSFVMRSRETFVGVPRNRMFVKKNFYFLGFSGFLRQPEGSQQPRQRRGIDRQGQKKARWSKKRSRHNAPKRAFFLAFLTPNWANGKRKTVQKKRIWAKDVQTFLDEGFFYLRAKPTGQSTESVVLLVVDVGVTTFNLLS